MPNPDAATLLGSLGEQFAWLFTDAEGAVTDVNMPFSSICGWSLAALIGQRCPFFWDADDAPTAAWQARQRGSGWSGEIRRRGGHGRVFWIQAHCMPLPDGSFWLGQDSAAQHGEARDDAVAILGNMVSAMVHEMKTPLAGVSMGLEVMGMKLAKTAEQTTMVMQARDLIRRLDQTLEDVARFAHPRPLLRCGLDLCELLRGLVTSPGTWGSVTWDLPTEVCPIYGDAAALLELCVHLLDNVPPAGEGSGCATVALQRDGSTCRLSVTDAGLGMAAHVVMRACEPFFTTRHGHLGLGLARATQIASAHGGSLTLVSTPSQGTCVTVILPASVPA